MFLLIFSVAFIMVKVLGANPVRTQEAVRKKDLDEVEVDDKVTTKALSTGKAQSTSKAQPTSKAQEGSEQ